MTNFVAVIGAGLTGLMAALHLAERGHSVVVFEKRSLAEILAKPYTSSGQPGRSMSMDISARGIFALKAVGVFSSIESEAIPMTHRYFHNSDGTTLALPYGKTNDEYVLAVSRSHLFNVLLQRCKTYSSIDIKFECSIIDIRFSSRELVIANRANTEQHAVTPSVIIGCDGVNSVVRSHLERSHNFQIATFPMTYKELSLPACAELSLNAMHKWARKDAMLVAQPNIDGSFTCALLMTDAEGAENFSTIDSRDGIRKYFDEHFINASQLMPDLENNYLSNPACSMKIVRGERWSRDGFVLLIGDAAHGMVPFFGQGVNCCFEDCTFLAHCLDEIGDDWPAILERFDRVRVADANAINRMSYDNYPELFRFNEYDQIQRQRQLEVMLMTRYKRFRSYHNLICFDRVPYTLAERIKQLQTQFVSRIEHTNSENWDDEFAIYRRQISQLEDGNYEL